MVALMILVLLGHLALVLQTPADAARADLNIYHVIIERYRTGDDDAAVEIARWEPMRVRRMHALVDRSGDPTSQWTRQRYEAAAMLHADAALALVDRGSEERDAEPVAFQLDAGGQLLQRAAARWPMRAFASRWYVTAARVLRDRNWLTTADRHLALARDRLLDDPGVLYESGTLAELLATDARLPQRAPPRSGAPRSRRDAWDPFVFPELQRRRMLHLNRAAGWLRQSLEQQPGRPLTHLHLGRVQFLRTDYTDAARHLDEATKAGDAEIAYLGWLYLGALHEAQKRLPAALDAYTRAREAVPTAQAARVAASELLHRNGKADEAQALLRNALRISADRRQDPWWHYMYDPPGIADRQLAALRQEVRR